ncbi:MAG: alpha/beta hydrolase [Nocardioidaceae bacterium]
MRSRITAQPHRLAAAVAASVTALALAAAGLASPAAQAANPSASLPSAPVRAAAPAANEVHAPIPVLNWKPCSAFKQSAAAQQGGLRLSCARATVPLDYDRPHGDTIKLFISKVPAAKPAQRIGTLFTNPGGPGGSASEAAPYIAQLLGPGVRNHFDVVGVDPRGVGGSQGVRCRSDEPWPDFPKVAFPLTPRQVRTQLRFNAHLRHVCAEGGNPILDHMTTADTARDMDLIRQAVGDERLTYYGVSYGTYLGATYAAMFPDRVRALIVDGVLDPVAWATGRNGLGDKLPFSTRLRSGVGAWDALTTAFAECDRVTKQQCPLSGSATEKWLRIIKRLKQRPFHFGDGEFFRYQDLIGATLGFLYSRDSYRPLMAMINEIHHLMFESKSSTSVASALRHFQQRSREVTRRGPGGPYGLGRAARPAFEAISCADSVNPRNPRAWVRAGAIADSQGPWFGRLWTWASSPCAKWPGSSADAFRGPWRVKTSRPVLVVTTLHDPATPINGARKLNGLFAGSRLLSVRTWGHGAIGTSRCITERFARYLVSGDLPVNGLVCKPNTELFPARR